MTTIDRAISGDPAVAAQCPAARTGSARGPIRRRVLGLIGVACVGLAWVGVVTPGVPTTIFLIIASWCFTRSCPWLEQRLLRNRVFGPYMRYVDRTEPMPPRLKARVIALMWTCVALSVVILLASASIPGWVPMPVIAAALVGTLVIRRW